MLIALAVLVMLALPALDLYLGQKDNGALPQSTDARRAYDGLTTAFGPGTNGPLLVSADMSKDPAKPDQAKIDDLDKQESDQKSQAKQKADKQEQQIAAQLEAQGVPPAQAQSQAEAQVQPQLDKQTKDIEDKAADQRKKLEQKATDPRLTHLRDDLEHTDGVKKVSEPLVNSSGTAAVLNVTPTTAPSDRATEQLVRRLRDDTIPRATKDAEHDRARRRDDGRLRRPRRRDIEPPDRDDRGRGGIELPAADDRLPLGRHPADRGADEPHLDRGRLRGGDRGLREGVGCRALSASPTRWRS